MTATVSADLFSADRRRERVVEWQAPGLAAKAGMSGMEAMCAIRDGLLPEPIPGILRCTQPRPFP